MKIKVFLFAMGALIATGANAQKGIDNGTQYGSGEDSINCIKNISLFIPYAKSGNYKDAYPFWKKVYDECPASNKSVYSYGEKIINWQISQEKDLAKKEALIDELMKLFDNRVKYFGNDKRYGKDWIIAQKAQDYNILKGDKTDPNLIYKWTGEVIDEYKAKTEPLAVSLYMFASNKIMQADETKKDQYVQDYLKCSSLLDEALKAAKAANNEKESTAIESHKNTIEKQFTTSGAADCETLQNLYATKVEENKDNLDYLNETIALLEKMRCKEIDVYFAASEYAYKLKPTAESATGLGGKAFRDGDLTTAEKYYNEAIGMTEDADKKADIYFALAAMAYKQHNYSKTKQYCLNCLSSKSSYGAAYLMMAQAYAAGAKATSDDPVLVKCVYYAVVDKCERARQADPSLAEEANKLIATYRQYFPTKEEVFMHPSLNMGDSYTIGGWIGESVKIR